MTKTSIDIDELDAMSEEEFAALPKQVQNAILADLQAEVEASTKRIRGYQEKIETLKENLAWHGIDVTPLIEAVLGPSKNKMN